MFQPVQSKKHKVGLKLIDYILEHIRTSEFHIFIMITGVANNKEIFANI